MINATHNFYNKNLKSFAIDKRKEMTKAEACLWKYALKSKQMDVIFNRQRPVLNYIADFMCKELKLIIDVDGYSHTLDDVIEKDLIRQTHLETCGFKMLRFKDSEILNEMARVRSVIYDTIQELKSNL